MDLHIHTPASTDYQEPTVTPLQILQQAETRGLDIVALTDHNSVRGYADLWREIEDLELLEYLKRLEPAEEARLREYRRLLGKLLLLPGFEFTATFGFHILAIFPESTSVRKMEHLLLLLGVPEERFGSGEVGATTDVLRAYEILDEAGAIVIGAHVNSTHGIAMQGLRFGGQTKIAYTQDPHLHALEVTDLIVNGHRRSTARFFSGIKAEYPRRMHCIQGSDAHRLERDPARETNLGIGDRATEVELPTVSFAALRALFFSDEFDRTRPYLGGTEAVEVFREARAEGNTAEQAFHENLTTKRTGLSHVLRDIVALANTGGGTVYVGASAFEKRPLVGVADPTAAGEELAAELARQVTPPLTVATEVLPADGKEILVVRVPVGAEKPYALAPGNIFVREDGESVPASRDQIVEMVRDARAQAEPATTPPAARLPETARLPQPRAAAVLDGDPTVPDERAARVDANGRREATRTPPTPTRSAAPVGGRYGTPRETTRAGGERQSERAAAPAVAARRGPLLEEVTEDAEDDDVLPTSGVEVIESYEQDGNVYYTVRDLKHQTYTHNVTRDTGKRLWRYAIEQFESQPLNLDSVRWAGDYGFLRSYRPRGGERRYNLVYRGDGEPRVFYGVSGEGLSEEWLAAIPPRRD
jgi:PHP family Zn ribbon phosphoesterase